MSDEKPEDKKELDDFMKEVSKITGTDNKKRVLKSAEQLDRLAGEKF